MPLAIQARQIRGIPVLDLKGSLTLGPAIAEFEREARRVLAEYRPSRLLLNFKGLAQMDSSGLGEVISIYTFAADAGCSLAVVGANSAVRQLMQITRIDEMVGLFDDEASALTENVAKAQRPY
ncbi:MAG TPA: STAS domain-containing protein [Bryobacteraceae bacterium]|nr:STAS domain-containing protein [Bryobacteraceae bacterium]